MDLSYQYYTTNVKHCLYQIPIKRLMQICRKEKPSPEGEGSLPIIFVSKKQ
jgi:hypothetical protein